MNHDDRQSGGGSSAQIPSAASTTDLGPAQGKIEADDSVAIGQIIDRYRILKKLGEGGMGEVYAAQHIHIHKKVAIKLLRSEILTNQEAVKRFYQEAQSASSLNHPNIISISDFGELPDGRIYLCMELLEGKPLNEMLKEPIPPERMLDILIQTCHGLAAAHARGIVHRDMKPENIFVTHGHDGSDVPKLLDFGIAKVQGTDGGNNLTKTGMIFGTPFYMAPEQAMGEGIDQRADIYAMGVIMYEVFTGSIPFEGESFMGILTKHITAEPEPPMQRATRNGRTLPPGIDQVILRAMKKNPAERYQSMDELTQALVSLRRSLVGPGMSSYMEAHHPQSGVMPAMGYAVPPSSMMPAVDPSGSMSHMTPASMSAMPQAYGHDSAASSVFASTPPKSSKTGIIAAVVAVLAVAGGIAGFLVISSKNDATSAVASTDITGQTTTPEDPSNTNGNGNSDVNGQNQTANTANTNAGNTDDPGNTTKDPDAPSTQTKDPGNGEKDPQNTTVITPTPVKVLVVSKPSGATLLRDGEVLGQAPWNVDVIPGQPVTITLNYRGYKDTELTLDGSTDRQVVKLKRLSRGSGDKPGNGQDSTQDEKTGDLGLGLE